MQKLFGSLLASIAVAGFAASAESATYSLGYVEPTPCGICAKWPTNTAWTSAAGNFRWSSIPAISVSTGVAWDRNDRASLLSDPGSATISISCSPTLAGGFSLAANGLTATSTTAYAGTCQYSALSSLGAFTALSDAFSVAAIAPAGDTIAPPKVTGVSATSGDVLSTTVSWDDAYDDGSGLDYYEVLVDGVVTATVQADELTNVRPTLTATNIGNASGGSCTKSSNQYTISASGNTGGGLDSTADGAVGCLAPISGPVCVTGLVNSLTLPATYSKGGTELRSTTDSNSIAYSAYGIRVAGGYNIELRRRSTTGGSRSNIGTSGGTGSITLPYWAQDCRDANNVVTGKHSSDGNTWTTTGSETSSLASSLYAGLSATATSASAIISAVIQEVNITSGARLSTTLTGLSGGAHTITVRGVDDAANTGTASAGVAITVSAPADTTPPTTPASPSCSNGGATSINCTATEATDSGSGIRGYIWACSATSGSGFSDAAEQASIGYALTGLTASTTRYCKVKAVDNSGNAGSYSVEASATTSAATLSAGPEITAIETLSVSGSNATIRITHTTPAGAATYHVYLCQVSSSATTTCTAWYYMSTYVHTSASVDMTVAANQAHIIYITAANADSSTVLSCTRSTNAKCTTNGYFLSSVATSAAIKWHPGYYVQQRSATQSVRYTAWNSVASNANVKGAAWSPHWGDYETSQGSYNFSALTAELNYLKALAAPKRMIIRMDTFGGYGRSIAGAVSAKVFPSYTNTAGCIFLGYGGGQDVPQYKWWRSDCMDYYIAFIQAMGAVFDSDPYFEGIILLRESGAQNGSVSTSITEYSASAYDTQLRRLYVAAKAAFPHTNVLNAINYLSPGFSETGMIPHIAYMRSIGVGFVDPDTCADCGIWGDKVVRGVTSGSTDYRGIMPIWMSAEVSEMGADSVGPDGGYTATQLASWDNATMHASHIMWDYNDWAGTSEQRWATGLVVYINANPTPTYTSCPTAYTSCDTN